MVKMHGSCELFCPADEAKMRIKERLLHFYEYKNGQKNTAGILVKAFSRSAAGVKTPKAKDMRTERCLNKTIEYLLKDILLDKRKPYHMIYDFIFDRLRAVRQEIVIQEYNAQKTIPLLEPMIMFLAYSRYHLCMQSIDNFDPKICDQHLLECLKRVLCCYDEVDKDVQLDQPSLRNMQRRNFIEALYQIFNLGASEALNRALSLPILVRQDATFGRVYNICLNYHCGNIYRVQMEIPKLPHILCAVASLKLQKLRRHLLEIFTHAYNNKQLTVPVSYLLRLTLIDDPNVLFEHCRQYNIAITADKQSVRFIKNEFKSDAQTKKSTCETFVDLKLQRIYLPEVLLLKKI